MSCRHLRLLANIRRLTTSVRRTYLTKSYFCEEAWAKRLSGASMNDVDTYDLLKQMNIRIHLGYLPSAVDVDVTANLVSSKDQLKDFEDFLYRCRHSLNSAEMLDSTHHAIARLCVKINEGGYMMKLLSDPINYGIFPDSYAANMLMNYFLLQGNNRDASKVACFLMQQEDFSIESTRMFMILSCLRQIDEPTAAEEPPAEASSGIESDEVIFRIPFLRNPHFDDHFDLVELDQLIGKTLIWTSEKLALSNSELYKGLIANCRLLGFALRDRTTELAEELGKFKHNIYKDVSNKLEQKYSDKLEAEGEKKEATEAAAGTAAKEPEKEAAEVPVTDENLEKIKSFLTQFKIDKRIVEKKMVDVFSEELKKRISDLEREDVEAQKNMFDKWNTTRERKLNIQIEQYLKRERLKTIEKTLSDLKNEEDYLFFFENKEKWERRLPAALFEKVKPPEKTGEILADAEYKVPEMKKPQIPGVKEHVKMA